MSEVDFIATRTWLPIHCQKMYFETDCKERKKGSQYTEEAVILQILHLHLHLHLTDMSRDSLFMLQRCYRFRVRFAYY